MTKEEIIELKRRLTEYGRNSKGKNLSRIIASKTGYKLDTISRVISGTNPANKPHHQLWLKMAEELMLKPNKHEDDGN
jgi:hypothetical protein